MDMMEENKMPRIDDIREHYQKMRQTYDDMGIHDYTFSPTEEEAVQSELTKEALDQARAQTDYEQRRVQEKQIRALRNRYRFAGAGILGAGQGQESDMSSKLGG